MYHVLFFIDYAIMNSRDAFSRFKITSARKLSITKPLKFHLSNRNEITFSVLILLYLFAGRRNAYQHFYYRGV